MRPQNRFYLGILVFSLLLLLSLGLTACGSEETPAAEQPAAEAQAPANPILGTWQDEGGTYTYQADGTVLVNGENTGQTYVLEGETLTEKAADGSTRSFKVQFEGEVMKQTAEDGSVYALKRVDAPVAAATQATGNASAPVGAVDTGFRPEVDGFSLENYGEEIIDPQTGTASPVVNLTSVEMRRMFGDAVCAAQPESDGSCALSITSAATRAKIPAP